MIRCPPKWGNSTTDLSDWGGNRFPAIYLTDDRGRTYHLDEDAESRLRYDDDELSSQYDTLQPGLSYDFALPFDIPKDASGLTLHVGDDKTLPLDL